MGSRIFPKSFLWGVGTSAYQVEGAWNVDNKGESIWDRFVHRPYTIKNGETGDISCDHYHHMPDDIRMMKELGVNSYRFSISWPRVLPQGKGMVNEKGISFYNRLVDLLLENGIVPNVTLNHWDLPQSIQDEGGWPNRDTANWFVDYARLMFDRLGDRVKIWVTHNEPWMIAFQGYALGIMAPGLADYSLAFQATHHLLLSHGLAVQAYRQEGYKGEIGIALSTVHFIPASNREEDIIACQRCYDAETGLFAGPLFKGCYPSSFIKWIGPHRPKILNGDMETIHQPIDFVGVNYYVSRRVWFDHNSGFLKFSSDMVSAPTWDKNALGGGIYPPGLTHVLLDLKNNYGISNIYITENGIPLEETPREEGNISDLARIQYIRAHLCAAHDAIQAGVNLKGYYVWSLMDNFEWAHGTSPRFGLVWTDFKTKKRIPKLSAYWYRDLIANNCLEE